VKILVVCQYYKPEPFRISDICEELVTRGHEVSVVTGLPNYPMGEIYSGYEAAAGTDEVIGGVKVHRCALHPRKSGALHRFWNYYSFVFSSCRYLGSLKEDYDVVFVNQLSPVMMAEGALKYAKKRGKKTVLYCLDLWPESLTAGGIKPGSLIYKVFYQISRRIYKAADEIVITSKGFEEYFRKTLALPNTPIYYLPQYAEELFDDIPPAKLHGEPYHFLFAGNIGEMQSVQTIVATAKLLEEDTRIRIDIVGDGSDLARCKELAQGLPNITFHGRKDVSEMPGLYTMADAMLVTLKDDPIISATLPGKVQSYMAAGRCVVGAITGETATVVQDADCGVCVAAENAAALADAMRSLADSPEKFSHYGENAKKYYQENFRKEAFINTLLASLARNSAN